MLTSSDAFVGMNKSGKPASFSCQSGPCRRTDGRNYGRLLPLHDSYLSRPTAIHLVVGLGPPLVSRASIWEELNDKRKRIRTHRQEALMSSITTTMMIFRVNGASFLLSFNSCTNPEKERVGNSTSLTKYKCLPPFGTVLSVPCCSHSHSR